MAVSWPLASAASWFSNQLINAVKIQANVTDPLNALPRGYVGENSNNTNVTLSSTSDFAGAASVTFTVAAGETRRFRVYSQARFLMDSGTSARYLVQCGYNSGSTPSIGSVTKIGSAKNLISVVAGTSGLSAQDQEGTVVLTAGTYTAYPVVTRSSGGSALDTASLFYVLVQDMGAA